MILVCFCLREEYLLFGFVKMSGGWIIFLHSSIISPHSMSFFKVEASTIGKLSSSTQLCFLQRIYMILLMSRYGNWCNFLWYVFTTSSTICIRKQSIKQLCHIFIKVDWINLSQLAYLVRSFLVTLSGISFPNPMRYMTQNSFWVKSPMSICMPWKFNFISTQQINAG